MCECAQYMHRYNLLVCHIIVYMCMRWAAQCMHYYVLLCHNVCMCMCWAAQHMHMHCYVIIYTSLTLHA